jgi:hypothetical protein
MRKLAYKALLWLVDWVFGPKWNEYDMNGYHKLSMKIPVGMQFKLTSMAKAGLPGVKAAAHPAAPLSVWGDSKKALRAMVADLKAHYAWLGNGLFGMVKEHRLLERGDEDWLQSIWALINLTGRLGGIEKAFDNITGVVVGIPGVIDFDALARAIERMPERIVDDPRDYFLREIADTTDYAEKIVAGKVPLGEGDTIANVKVRLADYQAMAAAVKGSRNLAELVKNLDAVKVSHSWNKFTLAEWRDVVRWLSAE